MEKEMIKLWEENKQSLERHISTTPQKEYDSYESLLKLIVKYILNTNEDEWSVEKISVIDDGDYQGTQIFLIPKNTYQPSACEYLVTYTYYGSCSGCDTLQSIHEYEDGLPNEEQVKDYMTLCLHLIQRMKYLYEDYC